MKKTLVAIAALTAVSAFAQTTVVMDGYFDRGYLKTNSTNNVADLKTISSAAGTTTVGIKAREEISSDLSVGGSVNTDWSDIGGASQTNAVALAQTSGFANSQSFVDVTSKELGTLRLGTPNNFTLTNATAIASPAFSTGVGSAYSTIFSIANGLGTGSTGYGGTVQQQAGITNIANVGARAIRINNAVQYSSPAFMGASIHLGKALQNNAATATSGAGNTVGVTEVALRYTAGPIDAMYSTVKYEVGSNGTNQFKVTTTAGGALGATGYNAMTVQDNTQNLLGVSYQVLPALKLNYGNGSFSSSGNNFKGTSQSFGGTYTMGMFDIMAQMVKVDDTSSTNMDRKLTGLGVNYNLSKTARAYFRYDSVNYASSGTAADGSAVKRSAIGVSKSF